MKQYSSPLGSYFIAFSLLFALSMNVSAQKKDKSFFKDPVADISISFMDLMSKNVSYSDMTILEKAYFAIGDKEFAHDNTIKSLIYNGSVVTKDSAQQITDTSYIKNCPHISLYRPADPLLVVCGVFFYRISTTDSNKEASYGKYMEWQNTKMPHSPLGANDPPDNYNDFQKQNWLIAYTRDWIIKYPDEYSLALSEFNHYKTAWQTDQQHSSISDFLVSFSKKVGHHFDQTIELLLHASATGLNTTNHKVNLPTDEMMRSNTSEFIQEIYETLYLRVPTKEELTFLEIFIKSHPTLTVKDFYYSMMTSNEYRYY